MVVTTMKSKFPKMPPKVITYKDMKNFDKDCFLKDLEEQVGIKLIQKDANSVALISSDTFVVGSKK